ncbi:energy transducer TonB [Thalassotalea profundi]|uniref:TonB C-terminal domain-containing protein n=1 Tax=Thalassotalea profundi TaxID=2036687 RepID=A0ABQ3IPV4_9GAMM|nr:energy transducer TonB [Thalassotalea profundi]GHE89070.1 hypothetical protein GCM10011501_18150 [Thalassotalea profundi]
MQFRVVKLMLGLFIVLSGHASANYAEVKLTHITPEKSDAQWLRTKQFTPKYPMELAIKGIAGCGVFKVIVDENGHTDNVELISSVPKRVIYKPARKVIKQWQWKNVSSQPNAIEEKLIRLDFCMGGATQAEAKAKCEEQAKLAC